MVFYYTVMQKYTSTKYNGFSEFFDFTHILFHVFSTLGYVLIFLLVKHSCVLFSCVAFLYFFFCLFLTLNSLE